MLLFFNPIFIILSQLRNISQVPQMQRQIYLWIQLHIPFQIPRNKQLAAISLRGWKREKEMPRSWLFPFPQHGGEPYYGVGPVAIHLRFGPGK